MNLSLIFLSIFATISWISDVQSSESTALTENIEKNLEALSEEELLEGEVVINPSEEAEASSDKEIVAKEEKKEIAAAVDNLGPTSAGFVADTNFGPDDDDVFDQRVLRDFIESRGLIQCRQKEGLLTIAGDVRARWVTAGEEVNGRSVRGRGTPTAVNQYRSEVNLFFDYETKVTWVSTKLRWSLFGGKDGGTSAKPDVDRAFIGYDVYSLGKEDFYIEVGRSRLDYLFESKIEFTSAFTGIHFYYTKCYEKLGSFVIHGGPFVTDAFTNHYSWVLEANVKELGGTPWGFKYSIIDWRRGAPTTYYGNLKDAAKKGHPIFDKKTIRDNPRYEFLVSQIIFGYQKEIDFLRCKTLYAYAAALVNHAAKKRYSTDWHYLNHGGYIGFTLGKLCKACDWSLDLNYQWVQAQALPEFDLAGFGRGNAADLLITDAILLGLPPSLVRGFTNYKGLQASLLFAMSDSLSLRAIGQYAKPLNRTIGGDFFYKGFDLSVIYAF